MHRIPTAVLLLLSLPLAACGFEHDTSQVSDYGKPGVSAEQRSRDVNQCQSRAYNAGGAGSRNVSMQGARTRECLRSKGYSHQRGYR